MPILEEVTCDKYFIVERLLKTNVAGVILLTYLLLRSYLLTHFSPVSHF